MDSVAIQPTRNIVSRSKYDKEVLPRIEEIYQWLCKGMTEYSIADELGISHTTLIEYKKNNVEMIEVYTRARASRNALVMNSMYSKALGEKVSVIKQKVASGGIVVDIREESYIPPDVNAADLYLRNNSDDYKSAKADTSGVTLIQNNYQLPQLQQQLLDIDEQLKRLEIIDTTSTDIT